MLTLSDAYEPLFHVTAHKYYKADRCNMGIVGNFPQYSGTLEEKHTELPQRYEAASMDVATETSNSLSLGTHMKP